MELPEKKPRKGVTATPCPSCRSESNPKTFATRLEFQPGKRKRLAPRRAASYSMRHHPIEMATSCPSHSNCEMQVCFKKCKKMEESEEFRVSLSPRTIRSPKYSWCVRAEAILLTMWSQETQIAEPSLANAGPRNHSRLRTICWAHLDRIRLERSLKEVFVGMLKRTDGTMLVHANIASHFLAIF